MLSRITWRLDLMVMACCLALLGYITWQIQQGPRGVGYSEGLHLKLTDLQTAQLMLAQANIRFEAKVRLLRPESIDPDLVDELARRNLGLARQNDLVILFPQ